MKEKETFKYLCERLCSMIKVFFDGERLMLFIYHNENIVKRV